MIEIAIVYCCTVMCFSAIIYKTSAKYKKLRYNNEKTILNTVSKEQMIRIANELRI